jgi:SAM-dependent methyltransferase
MRAAARELRYQFFGAPDKFPLPPPRLHELVVGTDRLVTDDYLRMGRACADQLVSLLQAHTSTLRTLEPVLDFGCGCGRVMRHLWTAAPGLRVWGTDINTEQVAWCQAHLPFEGVGVNAPTPPLALPDNSFGLAYAFSVFTHLPAELQRPWLLELVRVVRPGGYLLLSVHGPALIDRLTPSERIEFTAGTLVVHRPDAANLPDRYAICGAYHPPAYVNDTLAQGLNRLTYMSAAPGIGQDLYLFSKPSRASMSA